VVAVSFDDDDGLTEPFLAIDSLILWFIFVISDLEILLRSLVLLKLSVQSINSTSFIP
jgi:hypothetical protein